MTSIEFSHVSKQYRLGLVSTGTLSHDLNRFWQTKVLHREDPYLKIGELNDRATKGTSDYVWALKDIDFKVEQGDVVGIIGRNGAGKSTLLKLLSRVTSPTTGMIRARGRIASLLEVGTGFHPEMTGRENIYMNGAILGMSRAEITRKLDEIVDFSGCERYLDTPVKRYSSGMYVRLGFAIAAHLEPDILVVDEVLAVGDAEFQKKAIGKMQSVANGQGRTVLFVSHNMGAVKNLCRRGIVLDNGALVFDGTSTEAVDRYLRTDEVELKKECVVTPEMHAGRNYLSGELEIAEVRLLNPSPVLASDEDVEVELRLHKNFRRHVACQFVVYYQDESDVRIESYYSGFIPIPEGRDDFRVRMKMKSPSLGKGRYRLAFGVGELDFAAAATPWDAVFGALAVEVRYVHKALKDEFATGEQWYKGVTRTGSDMEVETR